MSSVNVCLVFLGSCVCLCLFDGEVKVRPQTTSASVLSTRPLACGRSNGLHRLLCDARFSIVCTNNNNIADDDTLAQHAGCHLSRSLFLFFFPSLCVANKCEMESELIEIQAAHIIKTKRRLCTLSRSKNAGGIVFCE